MTSFQRVIFDKFKQSNNLIKHRQANRVHFVAPHKTVHSCKVQCIKTDSTRSVWPVFPAGPNLTRNTVSLSNASKGSIVKKIEKSRIEPKPNTWTPRRTFGSVEIHVGGGNRGSNLRTRMKKNIQAQPGDFPGLCVCEKLRENYGVLYQHGMGFEEQREGGGFIARNDLRWFCKCRSGFVKGFVFFFFEVRKSAFNVALHSSNLIRCDFLM